MNARTCINCGGYLPNKPWWKLILGLGTMGPPFHDPNGPDADACWEGLGKRLGIINLGPRPKK